MSLINQMLKDLDSRRAPEPPAGGVLPGSRPASSTALAPLTLLLAGVIILLVIGLTYLLWQRQETPSATAPVAITHPAPTTTPAATAPAGVTRRATTTPPVTVVTPRQPPPVKQPPAPPPPAINSRLTRITPAVVDGSTEPHTLTLRGEALDSNHQVVVSWDKQERVLPGERVEWLDATTARIRLTTGNSDAQWQVALIRPDGSRSEAVGFEVLAAPTINNELLANSDSDRMKKVIHPPTAIDRADQLYQQGYRALQQRNSTGAERLWQQALTTAPGHLPSREGLIALYLSQGRKIESGKLLEEGLERHPGHAQFTMLHARLLAEQGDISAALATLEQAMGNSEPQADLFALAAALYQQRRDYDNSIRAYQRALQLQPQQGHWWMGIAISLEGAGKPSEAKSAYQEALQRGALSSESRQYVEQRLSALR
jgi:MSHA biogenesis protein MshN